MLKASACIHCAYVRAITTHLVPVYVHMCAQLTLPVPARFHDFEKDLPSLEGKIVCVTGCTTGTGFIAARTRGGISLPRARYFCRCFSMCRGVVSDISPGALRVSAPWCSTELFAGQLPRKEPMWSC